MTKILGWSVVRSGASLTVTGKDDTGAPVKLTKVDRIDGDRADGPVAVRGDDRFQLA